MAWKNQGGPWGGGGDGGGGGQGPWGGRGSGGGPSMPGAPDLEELLRRGQDRFRRAMPGGFGGGRVVGLAVLAGIALWLASGFYRVQPGEQGVEILFGKFVRLTTPGLNYWLP
ncbi:MAG: protease modulator HflK N-terminal domain-containing protein, partial [Pseudomonadota bacterium]